MAVTASGVVLAGGSARRMGRDKRLLVLDGRPLLALAVEAVGTVCDEVVAVTAPGRPIADAHGSRVVLDRRPDAGPLAGLEAGLLAARHDLVLVLAGDHPAASPEVLAALLERLATDPSLDAVALGTDRGPQPLVAAYRRRVAAVATRLLDQGERRARALLEPLSLQVLDVDALRALDPRGETAVDLDTPDDLADWEASR
jgi:molybdenum cofactor guanylyltransferase